MVSLNVLSHSFSLLYSFQEIGFVCRGSCYKASLISAFHKIFLDFALLDLGEAEDEIFKKRREDEVSPSCIFMCCTLSTVLTCCTSTSYASMSHFSNVEFSQIHSQLNFRARQKDKSKRQRTVSDLSAKLSWLFFFQAFQFACHSWKVRFCLFCFL